MICAGVSYFPCSLCGHVVDHADNFYNHQQACRWRRVVFVALNIFDGAYLYFHVTVAGDQAFGSHSALDDQGTVTNSPIGR